MRLVPLLALFVACGEPAPEAPAEAPAEAAVEEAPKEISLEGFESAPAALGATEWIKGNPVDLEGEEKLVLVEHWATWCGPCKEQMPHLTDVQAKYADDLVIVGLSDEEKKLVAPFVTKNSANMGYTVAIAEKDAMKAWARYAGADGIPYSYLLRAGKVLWHGHPGGLDKVLGMVVEGEWTAEVAAIHAALPKARTAYLEAIGSGTADDARSHAQPLLDAPTMGASVKNALSWQILTEVDEDKRDLALALTLAEQATAEANHWDLAYEDTLGLALFLNGKVEEAVKTQSGAVRLCEKQKAPEALCDELRERLVEFEQAEG